MIHLPRDFNEFLKLLNSTAAEYLVIGGYAVNYYGYSRSTGEMDVWIGMDLENAKRVASALQKFGFSDAVPEMLTEPNRIVHMGVPPMRIEILTSISGVDFAECFSAREQIEVDETPISIISLQDLLRNKRASGRFKDLADIEELGS